MSSNYSFSALIQMSTLKLTSNVTEVLEVAAEIEVIICGICGISSVQDGTKIIVILGQ